MNTLSFEWKKHSVSLLLLLCVVAVVDDATVVHSYPVTDPRRINHDKDSNGAKVRNNESEPDIGSTIELVFPSNLFPSATATDDSSDTNAKDGVSVSSGNGNDHEPPATTSSLMQ